MQFPADLVTLSEEILNKKLHFLCSESCAAEWTVVTFEFSDTQIYFPEKAGTYLLNCLETY